MWLPFHYGVAGFQVTGEINGLQVWREAANVLNKQFPRADNGWSSSLGVGWGLKTLHHNKSRFYEMLHRASALSDSLERPEWINLAQGGDQLQALVNTVMKSGFHKTKESSLVGESLLASQEKLS
jgi:hypothetical protein